MHTFDNIINEAVIIITKATNNVICLPIVMDPTLLTCELEDYESMLPNIERAIREKKYVVVISPRIKEILTDFEYKVFLYIESLVAIDYVKRDPTSTLSDKRIRYRMINEVILLGYGRFYLNALIKIRDNGCLETGLKEKEVFYLTDLIQKLARVCHYFKEVPKLLKIV